MISRKPKKPLTDVIVKNNRAFCTTCQIYLTGSGDCGCLNPTLKPPEKEKEKEDANKNN
mgnify:CR=1 FL=1